MNRITQITRIFNSIYRNPSADEALAVGDVIPPRNKVFEIFRVVLWKDSVEIGFNLFKKTLFQVEIKNNSLHCFEGKQPGQ